MSPQINFTTATEEDLTEPNTWFNIASQIFPPEWNLSFYVWHLLTVRTEVITATDTGTTLFFDWFVDGKFYTRTASNNPSSGLIDGIFGQENKLTLKIIGDSRWYWAAIWDKGLTDAEIRYLYSGIPKADWCRFDLKVNSGSYVSAEDLVHWWVPGDGDIGNDEIYPGAQLIDEDVNDWNIVNDFPGFFYAV